MRVTQWAAALSVSIAAFGVSPLFAQYPLYDSPSQQSAAAPATEFQATHPAYGNTYSPAPAYRAAPYNPGAFAQPAASQPQYRPPQVRGGYAAPQAVTWSAASPPTRAHSSGNPAGYSPRNVSFPLDPPALNSPMVDPRTMAPGEVSALSQSGGQPAVNSLPVPRPMSPTGNGGAPGQHSGGQHSGGHHSSAPPANGPSNQLPQGQPGHTNSPAQSHHAHAPGVGCPTCEGQGYYQQPYRPQRHPLRGFEPPYDHSPGWTSTPVYEGEVILQGEAGAGEYGFAAGGAEACCEPPPRRSPWYFTYKSLILTRDNENEVWFSYDTANIASQILGSLDARMGWRFGGDVRIGRYLDEGHHSVEMVYFGILSGRQEANAYGADMAGNLDSSFVFDSLAYDPGTGPTAVSGLFNNAERHQLVRSYRAHNAEINAWRHAVQSACGKDAFRSARISWLAGLRYMNYSEGFHFAADPNDRVFGNQPEDELRYDVSINNHLFGFQVGGMGEFLLNNRWQFTSTVKAGVMANRMDLTSFIGSTQRAAYVDNVASPYNNERFDIRSTKNDVSLLGELELGMRYRWSDYWSITGGYRAIGLSGVGLSTNQVPVYFADIGGVRQIDSNASLILHGVLYWGAEFNY